MPRAGPGADPQDRALIQRLLASLDRPQAVVEQAVVGRRFVAIRAEVRVGLASTLGAQPGPKEPEPGKRALGRSLGQCAAWLGGADPLLSSLGLAALVAACPPPPPKQTWSGAAQELLLPRARGARVVVVGDFPFTAELARTARRLDLLELRPRPGATPRPQWDRALAGCQLLLCTATALLSGGLSRLLAAAPQAFRVLLGPSTPLSPALFELGCQVLAGSRVTDPRPVLAAVAQGHNYRRIKQAGIQPICLFAPGLEPGEEQTQAPEERSQP